MVLGRHQLSGTICSIFQSVTVKSLYTTVTDFAILKRLLPGFFHHARNNGSYRSRHRLPI